MKLDELIELSKRATPPPWEARDASGAGLQIHGTLPAGMKFDCTCYDADGKTSFMLWTLRERVMVGIGDERWVQFETGQWKEMQAANAAYIVAACNAAPVLSEMVQIAMRLVPAPEDVGGHDDPSAPESIQAIVADAKRFKELADLLGKS